MIDNEYYVSEMLKEIKDVIKHHVGDKADYCIDIVVNEEGKKIIRIIIPDNSVLEIQFIQEEAEILQM